LLEIAKIESNGKKRESAFFLLAVVLFCGRVIGWWYFGPDVTVYVEGSYTENSVEAHIYADVYVSCLKGFGVQLIYLPNQLKVESIEENDDFLYTPLSILNHYEDMRTTPIDLPETSTPFESVYFVGNIQDSDDCKTSGRCNIECISDKRVLLGTVNFLRTEHSMPFDPSYLFITFASGNNTTDPMRDFDKDIGRTSYRTGSSNVRLHGREVTFGPIRIEDIS